MKKLIAIILSAVLLTGMTTAFADRESWICSGCGKESNGNYCPYCGAKKLETEVTCTSCREVYPLDLGYAFCPNCGRELPKATAPQQDTKTLAMGDIVLFGSYEQDNDTADGQEEIEWVVLDVQEKKALLISRYALDCHKYNSSRTNITWEECTLRTWLNDDFLNAAFSAEEQEQILMSKVTADKNPRYSTDPGNDTMDQIFLLSYREATEYFSSDSERQCRPTAYAEAHGCYANSDNGNVLWWLRSPGYYADYAASVNSAGAFNVYGYFVDSGSYAIRPTLWLNLES